MSDHDHWRELLALSATGELTPAEVRELRAHIAGCKACRKVGEDYSTIAGVIRSLPTPQPGSELVARVYALGQTRLPRTQGWRSEAIFIAPLVACSWAVAMLTWPLMRSASAFLLNWWQPAGSARVLAIYSVLAAMLSALVALAVAGHARMNGRTR